jgi:hypothetical protein
MGGIPLVWVKAHEIFSEMRAWSGHFGERNRCGRKLDEILNHKGLHMRMDYRVTPNRNPINLSGE